MFSWPPFLLIRIELKVICARVGFFLQTNFDFLTPFLTDFLKCSKGFVVLSSNLKIFSPCDQFS